MLGAAVISLQAGEAQAPFGRRVRHDPMRERPGRHRRHAAAALADVDLDEHVDLRPSVAHGRGQAIDAFGRVDGDRHPHAPRQRRHARQLARRDHLVGDVDVVDAGIGQGFGFARLLDADADRAGGDLQAGDCRAFVHLRVRPKAHPMAARERRHGGQVAFHRVEVEHQRRRVDRLDASTDDGGDGGAHAALARGTRAASPPPSPASSSGMSPSRCAVSLQPTSVKPRGV